MTHQWNPNEGDTDNTNGQRAEKAFRVLLRYSDDKENNLRDLLGDLMHYAAEQGIDFDDELRIARGHFDAEANNLV